MQHRPRLSLLRVALASAWLLGVSAPAWSQSSSYAEPPARVVSAAPGQSLARVQSGTRIAVVTAALRARGASDATAQSLVEVGGGLSKFGLTHLRFEQQVGGLTIYGSSVRATFTERGELVHLIERLAALPTAEPTAASINERQALGAAMAHLHPGVQADLAAGARVGQTLRFVGNGFFHDDPTVTRMLVPQANGSLAEGFLVQIWTQAGNLLDYTLVGGDGAILNVERRTANDSYNVFPVDPGKGGQTVVNGPGAGNAQSPAGWLGTGTQTTININGNNVSAYLDADANNAADSGGTAVTNGDFRTSVDLAAAPTTTANRAVAVQNLFYLNNVIHDILYSHGFNEAAGNFQIDNFGKGGAGNDPVNAEAQDGGGTDNANFATPSDGSRPRMQMYLWTGAGGTHEVAIAAGSIYDAMGAAFGPSLTTTGLNGSIVLGNDGKAASGGGTINDGCEALPSSVKGKIVLLDRGLCNFTTKVLNAQSAGAVGVIIANNVGTTDIFTMGGSSGRIRIPSVMVSYNSGAALRSLGSPTGTMRKKAVQPLQIDGDLDSDIVYHEYGHGLTWRMIGGMSGPLAGAIGEGASDVVAFMVNGDGIMGEYAYSNPLGIRRYPYDGYPLTYGDVTGAEVHDDGEIYAGAMWRLRTLWLASTRSNDSLFDHFVDGMNYTPSTPAFEHMRNGMLDSVRLAGLDASEATARCVLVWQAFAQSGIGVGATGTVTRQSKVSIKPSFVAGSDCTY